MRRGLCQVLSLIALAGLAAACEPTTIIEPEDPEKVTVPFNGTLTVNGAATHRFTAQNSGDINVILKSLTPAVGIHLGLGVWTGASCNIIISDDNALGNATLIGTATAAGEFCARVADVGRLTGPTEYALEVTHF